MHGSNGTLLQSSPVSSLLQSAPAAAASVSDARGTKNWHDKLVHCELSLCTWQLGCQVIVGGLIYFTALLMSELTELSPTERI